MSFAHSRIALMRLANPRKKRVPVSADTLCLHGDQPGRLFLEERMVAEHLAVYRDLAAVRR